MKECSSLTRFVGVKIALMCEICICENMMAWALCVCEKTKPTIKFITKMQRDFKQEVVRVWLWSLKNVVELVVELFKSLGFSSGLLIDYGFRWSIIQYLSMVFFPLKLGESYPYLGLSSGLLIDYGLGDALISLHGVLAFEIGWIKLLFKIFRWSSYWFWFKFLFNASPWVFLPLNYG